MHANVTESVCGALVNLAINADNTLKIVARGGLELLLAAFYNHPTHAGVNLIVCQALANFAESPRAAIEQSGALAIVQAAMSRFPNNENIQSVGRHFLCLLH
jgi:hypothetical protein